jgi:RNA polymerase sigma-70 factor (ECF subfamily)
MQTAQEIGTFQRQRAEVPHDAVAIALTPAEVDRLAEAPTAQEAELDSLARKAKDGDRGSFEALLAAVRPRAMATAMKILRNGDDAEDAVQEAFVKIWRSFRRFEGRSAFSTWVHRIVMNASLDLLRRSGARHENHAKAQPQTHDQTEIAQEIEPSNDRTPETELSELETQLLVRTAIARLPLLHRQAVELRELEDCSYQEMADIIHCPIGTVMSRLHHARHRLAEDLSQPFADRVALAAA